MKKNTPVKNIIYFIITLFVLIGCTFDYGETESSSEEIPDLVMENVDYVRVRSADPIARFQAERAERYEELGEMRLQNFTFEQFGATVEEINAYGEAGYASVDINTSDIFMDKGVKIGVESEDIVIETNQLEWKDEAKTLSTGEENIVNISQSNDTSFIGTGLSADARRRTWEFKGSVSGVYIQDDDEEAEETEIAEEGTETIPIKEALDK